ARLAAAELRERQHEGRPPHRVRHDAVLRRDAEHDGPVRRPGVRPHALGQAGELRTADRALHRVQPDRAADHDRSPRGPPRALGAQSARDPAFAAERARARTRTRVDVPVIEEPDEGAESLASEIPQQTSSRFLRNTATMSAGIALSRLTGFLRLSAMAYAIGVAATRLADAYNVANNTPNIVYELVLGGVLTSVFVPVFVEWLQDHEIGRASCRERV